MSERPACQQATESNPHFSVSVFSVLGSLHWKEWEEVPIKTHTLAYSPYLVESGMHITWKHFIFIPSFGLDDRLLVIFLGSSAPQRCHYLVIVSGTLLWLSGLFCSFYSAELVAEVTNFAYNCPIPGGTHHTWKCDRWMPHCLEAVRRNCIGNRLHWKSDCKLWNTL